MTGARFLPVAKPSLGDSERAYVLDCVETSWISSIGPYIGRFEAQVAKVSGTARAISCCNGTVALHLALLAAGVGPGDEVLVPSLTYIASANTVRYCGAEPVFVDSDLTTWNIDPEDAARKWTPRTRAIMPVHLYGRPAPMAEIVSLANLRGGAVIEDAAEAIGATYRGSRVGSLGTVGALSFFGNKIVTCGEGGAVVTSDPELAEQIRQIKGQGQDPERRYWFPMVGYNYRMTNIQAALGVAQLEKLDEFLAQREQIAKWYREALEGVRGIQLPAPDEPGTRSVCWLYSVVLESHPAPRRDAVMAYMQEQGIETRPFFYPCHVLPPYQGTRPAECPRAEWLASRGISLPTWIGLERSHVERVCRRLVQALSAC